MTAATAAVSQQVCEATGESSLIPDKGKLTGEKMLEIKCFAAAVIEG